MCFPTFNYPKKRKKAKCDRTNQTTNGPTDMVTYRVACTQLKMRVVSIVSTPIVPPTFQANPDKHHKTHKVPLLKAVKCAYVDIVMELLSRGANPNAHDKHGRLPINWAFNRSSYKNMADCNKMVKLLLYSKGGPDQRRIQTEILGHSFARSAHSFACSLVRLLTLLTPSLVGK